MLFDIASLGKNYVAVPVLQLAEEGKLSLDHPLGKWLPDYPHIDAAITVRQLLNHTRGIFERVEYRQAAFRKPFKRIEFAAVSSPDEVVTMLVGKPYIPRGRGFRYSSTHYKLLRIILEKVTGSTVAQEVRTRFLDPLNLKHTVVLDSPAAVPETLRVAHAWWGTADDGTLDDISARFTSWIATRSPAVVYSTAGDLARWSQAICGGEVLSQESLAKLFTFHFDDLAWFAHMQPRISAVANPAYDLGAGAAELLVKRMSGKLTGPPQRKILKTELLVRESSTAKLKMNAHLNHSATPA